MYYADRAANNRTLQSAIAGAMTGVTSDQVTNITVTSAPAARTTHPNMRGYLDTTNSGGCVVQYQVLVETVSESVTFASLTAELEAAAQSGRMNQLLQHYATLYNTTALQNCSMSVPTTINLRPEVLVPSAAPTAVPILDDAASVAPDRLTNLAIAGITLGSICFVWIFLYLVYLYRTVYNKKHLVKRTRVLPIEEEINFGVV